MRFLFCYFNLIKQKFFSLSSLKIKAYAQQSLSILRAFTYPTLPIYFKEYQIQANAPIAQEQQVIMDTTTSKDQQQSIYSTLYNASTELNGNNGETNNSYGQNRDILSVKKLNYSNSNENMLNNGAYNETSSLKRKTSMENGVDDHYENMNSMTKKFQNEPSSQNSQNSQNSQYLKYNKILNNQANKAKPINNENSKQDSNGNDARLQLSSIRALAVIK